MTDFDRWETQARTALADHGIGYHQATPLIDDARSHHRQSGADPWQALGPPAEFAADVAADQPQTRAAVDTQGKTVRDHLGDGVFAVALMGVMMTLLGMWKAGGITIPVTTSGAAGLILLGTATFTGVLPGALRTAGHPRAALWGWALPGVLFAAAVTAFSLLPRERAGEISGPGLLAILLILCWLPTRPTRAKPAPGPAPADPAQWFARLHDLLVGRFDVAPGRAATLVDEARAHVAAAGTDPRDEFPSPEQHALNLADGEPHRQPPWWRTPTAETIAQLTGTALTVVLIGQAFLDGNWLFGIAGSALLLWLLGSRLRAPGRTARSAARGG